MEVERWPEAKLNCRVAVSGKKGLRERHKPSRRGEVMRQVERRMKRWWGGRDILYLIISKKDSERNSKSRAVNDSYVYWWAWILDNSTESLSVCPQSLHTLFQKSSPVAEGMLMQENCSLYWISTSVCVQAEWRWSPVFFFSASWELRINNPSSNSLTCNSNYTHTQIKTSQNSCIRAEKPLPCIQTRTHIDWHVSSSKTLSVKISTAVPFHKYIPVSTGLVRPLLTCSKLLYLLHLLMVHWPRHSLPPFTHFLHTFICFSSVTRQVEQTTKAARVYGCNPSRTVFTKACLRGQRCFEIGALKYLT